MNNLMIVAIFGLGLMIGMLIEHQLNEKRWKTWKKRFWLDKELDFHKKEELEG